MTEYSKTFLEEYSKNKLDHFHFNKKLENTVKDLAELEFLLSSNADTYPAHSNNIRDVQSVINDTIEYLRHGLSQQRSLNQTKDYFETAINKLLNEVQNKHHSILIMISRLRLEDVIGEYL